MKTILKYLLIISLYSLFVLSCSKDNPIKRNEINPISHDNISLRSELDDNYSFTPTIMGEQILNPFSLTYINQALVVLYGNSKPPKSPTHLYIKFKPESEDQLSALVDWELSSNVPLFDVPFDYDIQSFGDYYIDPGVSDSLLTYLYASVPVNTSLPEVPYEVLDQLYHATSNPLLIAESFRLTNHLDEVGPYFSMNGGIIDINTLDNEALELVPPTIDCPDGCVAVLTLDDSTYPFSYKWECDCDNHDDDGGPVLNECGCVVHNAPNIPAGCVQVDQDGTFVPVQIAFIKVRYFSLTNSTFTDDDGCWEMVDKFPRFRMWIKFFNANVKVRDTRYWGGALIVKDYVGKFTSTPYNKMLVRYEAAVGNNASNARMYWASAHTLNTVNEYQGMASADGVPLPRGGLNWTNNGGEGGASTPMLQGHAFSSWPAFLAAFLFPSIYASSLSLLPDITNQYAEDETAVGFKASGFHELGHASHYSLAGESYWFGYRNHIVNNGGYGSFGNFAIGSSPGKVALGEAIGNFTGAIYGGTFDGSEEGEWGDDNFIPQGLMWDLEDDTPWDLVTDPNQSTIQSSDNVSGFTRSMIFDVLSPTITNIRLFRDQLSLQHIQQTPNDVNAYNTFVDVYDVFNN